jgi:hypothetical protein
MLYIVYTKSILVKSTMYFTGVDEKSDIYVTGLV